MKDTTFFSPPMSEVKEAKPPSSSEEGPLELGIATAFREYPRISKHLWSKKTETVYFRLLDVFSCSGNQRPLVTLNYNLYGIPGGNFLLSFSFSPNILPRILTSRTTQHNLWSGLKLSGVLNFLSLRVQCHPMHRPCLLVLYVMFVVNITHSHPRVEINVSFFSTMISFQVGC